VDSLELTEEQLRSMRPLREVHPDLWEKLQQYKRGGTPIPVVLIRDDGTPLPPEEQNAPPVTLGDAPKPVALIKVRHDAPPVTLEDVNRIRDEEE
jgi:hypothetical protein